MKIANERFVDKRLVLFAVASLPALLVGFIRPQWWVSFLVGAVSFAVFLVIYD